MATATVDEFVQRSGYHNFGSFHTDNVDGLILIPDKDYQAPTLPFSLPEPHPPESYGEDMRSQFYIDFSQWCFVNHGAFGGVCKGALEAANLWREHCEKQPLKFLDRELFPQLIHAIRDVAKFVNCRPEDVVFVPNATMGLNTVISSIPLGPGDAMYILDVGYGSVRKMVEAACSAAGATVVVGSLPLPVSGPQDVVDLVGRTLPAGARLAVVDVVTSNTALTLPVEDIVRLCHDRGVPVLVDAAHALGALPLDITALGADWVVANCHKWLSAPRGSAILWAHPLRRDALRPLVVSHGAVGGFTSRFIWDGNRDYSPYLAVPAALAFWHSLPGGPDKARQYMACTVATAAAQLRARWPGAGPALAPATMHATMALVPLPPGLAPAPEATSADAKFIQDELHYSYQVECPVKAIGGRLFLRISAHVYNTHTDYERLGDAIDTLLQRLRGADADQATAQC